MKWYSLFSHTGSETEAVRFRTDADVELVTAITNNGAYQGSLPCIKLPTGRDINQWLMTPGNVEPNSLITLNGYMRILPAEVIDYLHDLGCMILNIHPAPIQLYPELRGADPQERLYEGIQSGRYAFVGVVVHWVDTGVDTGDILYWNLEIADTSMDKADLYSHLHDLGTDAWLHVFEEVTNG